MARARRPLIHPVPDGQPPSVEVVEEVMIPLDYKRAMVQMGAAMRNDNLNPLDSEFQDAILTDHQRFIRNRGQSGPEATLDS
jgi:hypothetical protein